MTQDSNPFDFATGDDGDDSATAPRRGRAARKIPWVPILSTGGAVALCVGLLAVCCGGFVAREVWVHFERANVERQVQGMMEDREHRPMRTVTLARKSASEYDGIAVDRDGREASVQVTCDGANIVARWQWLR